MKITLTSDTGNKIATTCKGVSLNSWDQAAVHSLSKVGKRFIGMENFEYPHKITITTPRGEYRLVEITETPLP